LDPKDASALTGVVYGLSAMPADHFREMYRRTMPDRLAWLHRRQASALRRLVEKIHPAANDTTARDGARKVSVEIIQPAVLGEVSPVSPEP
jgi:hypothetical protein